MNRKKSVLWLLFFLLFCTLEIEAKRSFSIRTRSKSSGTQYNSRRKSHRDGGSDGLGMPGAAGSSVNTGSHSSHVSDGHSVPSGSSSHGVGSNVHGDSHALTNTGRLEREAVIGKQTGGISSKASPSDVGPQNQRPVGWDVNNNHNNKPPAGPPPPYPGLGGNSNTYNNHPPSYYQSVGNPPTYAASQAHYGVGNAYGYPNTGTHGQGSPSFTGTGYSGVNSGTLNGAGYAGQGGGSLVGGGLSNQYPNNHGGIGTSGFNNGNGQGAYGSNYGYQKSGLFSTGNILTGLATWQVARALTPSRHHSHVQNNYYANNGTQAAVYPSNQAPLSIPTSPTMVTAQPQGELIAPAQSIKLPVPVH